MANQQTEQDQNIVLFNDILTESTVDVIIEDERYSGEVATKLGQLIALLIQTQFPSYLTNNIKIFVNFSQTEPGYALRAKQQGVPTSFMQISFNETSLLNFIENTLINLRVKRDLQILEAKLDYLLNNPESRNFIATHLGMLLTKGQISHIYHELMHNFINKIYETSSNLINIEEYSQELEEYEKFVERINENLTRILKVESWGEIDYAELTEANNIAMVQTLLELCKDENEAFTTFAMAYNVGVQELWVRLEEARADYYKNQKLFKNPLYPTAESIINELRDYNYVGHVWLPGVEKVTKIQELFDISGKLTPELIDKYIKETIIPMLERKAIKAEWERLVLKANVQQP